MNLEKLLMGAQQIIISGKCNTPERRELLEEALKYFQDNPSPSRECYFGIKNYAGFGDQRSDHPPFYGPKHGSIVFSIDYLRKEGVLVDESGIYYIIAALSNPDVSLNKVIYDYLDSKNKFNESSKLINSLKIEDIS